MKRRPWHRWRISWGKYRQVESFHTFRWAAVQSTRFAPPDMPTRIDRLS